MESYLFYDIETTGLNKAFDQVLQFAAIRTDRHLNELERCEIIFKLNPDVTPSPFAMITHHLSLKDLANGMNEFEGIKQIHHWLNIPGTISLGYNTLRFDDEFLRFSFYRNLLPPYTHQYANQCSRMDIYPMTVMYYLFKNNVLNWPTRDGKPTFKLADLSAANQLAEGQAHNAMVDVEATLALARILFQEREMWGYLCGYFIKEQDQSRMRELQRTPALMVDGILGAESRYQSPVLFLGMHQHYKNQMLWLRLDSEELSQLTFETIPHLRVTNKKLGEPSFILPFKDRFLQHLSPQRKALAQKNFKWLEENADILKGIVSHHANYQYPLYPETDVAAGLYINGFWNYAEENFCRSFHAASHAQKAKLTEQMQNPKLKMLALRILGKHYPEVLSAEQAEQFEHYMLKNNPRDEAGSLMDYQGKRKLTPRMALKEINELRKDSKLTDVQVGLLNELQNYLERLTGL